MHAEQTDPSPLGRADGWRDTSVYGLAHFGKSLFWYGGEILFAYFLTDIAHLSPSAMGVTLISGFVLSAGLDLLIGVRFGGRMADPRSAGRLQLIGAAFSGVALLAFFATPFLPPDFRLSHALLTGVAFRLAYAVYDVPQNALIALAGAHSQARTRLATVRIACSGAASLAIAAAVAPVLAARTSGQDAALLLQLAAAAVLIALGSAWWLERTLRSTPQLASSAPSQTDARGMFKLWPLLAVMTVMSFAPPLFQKLEPYFATYVLRSPLWGGAIILAVAAGQLLGQPLWFHMSQRRSRREVLARAAIIQAAGGVTFLASPLSAPLSLVGAALLVGLGNGGMGMALWAAFGDAVRRHVPGRESVAFATFTAAAKLGLAAGVALVSFVLISPATRSWIMGAMAGGTVLGSLATIVLIRAMPRDPVRPRTKSCCTRV